MGLFARDSNRLRDASRDQKDREQESEVRDVPLHRAYGVRRRVSPLWQRIEKTVYRLLALWIYFPIVLVGSVGLTAFLLYYPELWVKVLLLTIIAGIFVFRLTRPLRIRWRFLKKLKRLCKKHRYSLKVLRPFLRGFRWSDRQADFRLQTKNTIYEIHFLTVRRYRSELRMDSKERILLQKKHLKNRFNTLMDVREGTKIFSTNFPPIDSVFESTRRVRGIVVNPVCREMLQREPDGGLVTTGSGTEIFGYTVYTATGFLETIQRDQ